MTKKEKIKQEYLDQCSSLEAKLPNLYKAEPYDRMFMYEWYIVDDIQVNSKNAIVGECKPGDHWVPANEDPLEHISRYVRKDQKKRKDKFDEGKVRILWIWDVSEYAKKHNKFYIHSKIDEEVKKSIGHVKQNDVYSLDPITFYDRFNALLKKEGQPLPVIGLKAGQYRALMVVLGYYYEGARVILGDLYARFGKTIFSLALSMEMEWKITVIATYVKTSFRSYENDMSGGEQFKDMVGIHASDPNYKKKIKQALNDGKRIIVFLSLCKGSKRDDRIKYLLSLNVSKGLIVDEADFGAWRPGQSEPLRDYALKNNKCQVFLMSGSNIERASVCWPVDAIVLETYYEGLVDKQRAEEFLKIK